MMQSVGLLVLRLGMGGYMMTHGWGKVQMVLNRQFDQLGDPIGLGNTLSLILATGAEFFCALLVVIGLGTRVAAIPVVITMGVAAFIVHGNDPWTMGAGASKEPALLFLTAFLTLVFTGGGRFSFDALIVPWWQRRKRR
jgi:putative oxidoreductase